MNEHQGKITALEFSGKSHLLSASEDGTIIIWRTSDWMVLRKLSAHKNGVRSISVHPSGRIALSLGEKDGMLKMWNLIVGKVAYQYKFPDGQAEIILWSPSGDNYLVVFPKTISFYSTDVFLFYFFIFQVLFFNFSILFFYFFFKFLFYFYFRKILKKFWIYKLVTESTVLFGFQKI